MEIGEQLRRLRKASRYTLLQVSEQTGLSVSFLSDIERGNARPSLDTLEKLAKYYQVSLGQFFPEGNSKNMALATNRSPGFREFVKEEKLEQDLVDLLLTVESRSSQRARTKEDWKRLYYSLKSILGR